jgi:biotin operon repressor
MSRADRLLNLADLLRGRDVTTVNVLANELGISRRTVLRDLASLRARGLPITGEPGHGGGLRLEHDRGVAAVHMSIAEVAALWLAARLSREASDLPWAQAAHSGLAKLLACLPALRSRELRSMCRRVIIGPPASNYVRGTAGTPPRELLRRSTLEAKDRVARPAAGAAGLVHPRARSCDQQAANVPHGSHLASAPPARSRVSRGPGDDPHAGARSPEMASAQLGMTQSGPDDLAPLDALPPAMRLAGLQW